MIWVVDLEPLEQRYTKQWRKWFELEWPDCKFISALVTTDKIEKGRFLDIIGTNLYKSEQVINFCNFVKSGEINTGDTLLFMDGWHPGVIQMKYISDLMKLDLHFSAIFHAGSYDPWDFLSQAGMGYWAGRIEEGFGEIFENIFVASNYHKELLEKAIRNPRKIHVTGLPFYRKLIAPPIFHKVDDFLHLKDNLVVFTSRSDPEKQPQVFDEMSENFGDGVEFVKTLQVTSTKNDYYNFLRRAKVVYQPVLQETFGIGVLEAVSYGVLPVVPKRLSYAEMWPNSYSGDDLGIKATTQIAQYLFDYEKYAKELLPELWGVADWYELSIERMRGFLE